MVPTSQRSRNSVACVEDLPRSSILMILSDSSPLDPTEEDEDAVGDMNLESALLIQTAQV